MSKNQGTWQKALKEESLPHQLRIQSHQIDRVLNESKVSAHVSRGVVTNKHIQFDLHAHIETGLEKLRGLKQDLLLALGVEDIQLSREDGQLRLKVQRPENPPVPLLEILSYLPEVEPVTATLGLSEDGSPVLLEFAGEDLSHILLIGDTKAGKTALLRTIAVSLALSNKQSQLQMLVINGDQNNSSKNEGMLQPLSYLPHLLEPVVYDLSTAVDVLQFLAREAQYRIEQNVKVPTIVVLIDHVVALLEDGGQLISDALITLSQKGGEAGIHLILSTHRPDSERLDAFLQANIPVRIVGRMSSESAGILATGKEDAHPEYLFGEGDFLAVTENDVTHFQGAYIGDYDLHLTLDRLHRNRPKPILAQSFSTRTTLTTFAQEESDQTSDFVVFRMNGEVDLDGADMKDSHSIDEPQDEGADGIPFDAGHKWVS